MLERDLAAEILERLRSGLREKGEFGRFLIAEADRALAAGVEHYQEDITYSTKGKSKKSGKQAVVRRPATEAEALLTLVRVLRAYLTDLPAAATSAARDLAKYTPLDQLTVSFHSEIEREEVLAEVAEDIDLRDFAGMLRTESTEREIRRLEALIVGTEPEGSDAATVPS